MRLLLIKPSHHDDDGDVIQWWRSSLPSNSLAAVHGNALECARRGVLAPLEPHIEALDETNTRIHPERLARAMRADGEIGLVGLVGVQPKQYPRALDLARRFRAEGLPVVIGGFHVSGCMTMLKELPVEPRDALDAGISLFAGELEGRLVGLPRDALAGRMKPVYDYLVELPDMNGTPTPYLPPDRVKRTMGKRASFDAGRGCPYLCSFCTIINVQGRVSRHRAADHVEALIHANAADGIGNFFITDDSLQTRGAAEAAILDATAAFDGAMKHLEMFQRAACQLTRSRASSRVWVGTVVMSSHSMGSLPAGGSGSWA